MGCWREKQRQAHTKWHILTYVSSQALTPILHFLYSPPTVYAADISLGCICGVYPLGIAQGVPKHPDSAVLTSTQQMGEACLSVPG